MSRTMYDSIESTVLDLPDGADLYAGYDDGHWPDASAIALRFPTKTVIRITVDPSDDEGDMLDVENGDATPADAPPWIARRRAAGHGGPLVYCSLSIWGTVQEQFVAQGVPGPGYIVAAYPGPGPVIPAGACGHQYEDAGTYDLSVVQDHLPGIDPTPTPPPAPAPAPPAPAPVIPIVNYPEDNVTQIGPFTLAALDKDGNGSVQVPNVPDVTKIIGVTWIVPDPNTLGAYDSPPKSWAVNPTAELLVIEGGQPGGQYGCIVTVAA
jgi:hypothetical protein